LIISPVLRFLEQQPGFKTKKSESLHFLWMKTKQSACGAHPLAQLELGWCQDNRNRSNQESKFDFLATRQQLEKIDGGQQKLKVVGPRQPTDNQIYAVPANQFSPSAGTT